MATAETFTVIFVMIVSFGCLALSFKRDAIMWAVIATVIFTANVLFSAAIPYSVNAQGEVIGTAANVILTGVNLLFAFVSLFRSVYIAYNIFR